MKKKKKTELELGYSVAMMRAIYALKKKARICCHIKSISFKLSKRYLINCKFEKFNIDVGKTLIFKHYIKWKQVRNRSNRIFPTNYILLKPYIEK